MAWISPDLYRAVLKRAGDRCEYCGLPQEGQEATFHIDHVLPVAKGGQAVEENLCLACVSCSLRKGARRTAVDPQTDEDMPPFDPRRERWAEHFRFDGVNLVGLTPTGRATVEALQMNRPLILAIRQAGILLGRHPPSASDTP